MHWVLIRVSSEHQSEFTHVQQSTRALGVLRVVGAFKRDHDFPERHA